MSLHTRTRSFLGGHLLYTLYRRRVKFEERYIYRRLNKYYSGKNSWKSSRVNGFVTKFVTSQRLSFSYQSLPSLAGP